MRSPRVVDPSLKRRRAEVVMERRCLPALHFRLASSCQRSVPPLREGRRIHSPAASRARIASRAGIEPALLGSEASVLPLDDPESYVLSRLGGGRTLASPVKSRVRYRYAT